MDTHMGRARSRRELALILVAGLLWGTVGIAGKAIRNVADTDALSIGFMRLAIAAPVLIAACWYGRISMWGGRYGPPLRNERDKIGCAAV